MLKEKIKTKYNLSEQDLLDIVDQSCKEVDASTKAIQNRVPDWQLNEDLYYLRKQPALPNMSNYLLPIMPGFLDTLIAKTDDAPVLSFSPQETSDIDRAKEAEKIWQFDAGSDRGDWNYKDVLMKKSNAVYGRSTAFYYATVVNGKYVPFYILLDPYDFKIDPLAGGIDIEKGNYMGVDNLLRSKYDFNKRGTDKLDKQYIKENIDLIFSKTSRGMNQENAGRNKEKLNRREILGHDSSYNYQSEESAVFTMWFTTYKGTRWYLMFSYEDKLAVRIEPVINMFPQINEQTGKPFWPFASWATYPDAFDFYSPAPADRLRDIIFSQSDLINQEIDNRNFQNFGMLGYDPDIIKNPALLTPRPRGLVPMNANGKDVSKSIFQFRYNLFSNTESLFNVLGGINSKESGITPDAQGMSDPNKKVGVYEGDVANVADRMGLINKSYKKYYERLGRLWLNNLIANYTEKTAITIFGEDGVKSKKIMDKDLENYENLGIVIKSGSVEAKAKEQVSEGVSNIMAKALEFEFVNKKETFKIWAEMNNVSVEQIEKMFDVQETGYASSIISASQDNQDIIKGKTIKPNKGANNLHLKKHMEFLLENQEYLKPNVVDNLMAHMKLEIPIAIHNFALKQELSLINNQQINEDPNAPRPGTGEIPQNQQLPDQANYSQPSGSNQPTV